MNWEGGEDGKDLWFSLNALHYSLENILPSAFAKKKEHVQRIPVFLQANTDIK